MGDERLGDFSHFDETGASRMVDVTAKPLTLRRARASGLVRMLPSTQAALRNQHFSKGNVLEVARLAAIMAAKRTGELIPLCHPLPLEAVTVDFGFPAHDVVAIEAEARVTGRTGVEMEAMTAVAVAALTIYDMCKSADRSMTIEQVRLDEKDGGRSGHYVRDEKGK